MSKANWEIDVPVLIIFHKRKVALQESFAAVKKARPSTLLLWQDGPKTDADMEDIIACRRIVEDIDWDCTVYKKYNEKNFGCDPSTFYSHKWAFSIVEKCIVLEDDFIANQSFFHFCKELLDKYEDDERINHICGMNLLGNYEDCKDDYFFGYAGTNAWASWRRVVSGWDEEYSFLQNERSIKLLRENLGKGFDRSLKKAVSRNAEGIPYWETLLSFDCWLNSRLAIIASKNLVANAGMTADSTHSNTQKKYLTKREKMLFSTKTYELEFPLKHPKYVVADNTYFKKLSLISGKGHPIVLAYRRFYHMFKYVLYGDFKKIFK